MRNTDGDWTYNGAGTGTNVANDTLDFRLNDIDLNTDGKLEFGYNYGKANLSDIQEKDPGYSDQKGHLVTVGIEIDVVEAKVQGVVGHVGAGARAVIGPVAVGVAHPGHVRLGEAQVDVLDAGTRPGNVPVVVIVDMHVMALVVALAGPEGGTGQGVGQEVLGLHVELANRAGAVGVGVAVAVGGFPVVGLVGLVGNHAVDVEALLDFLPHFLAQADLGVGLTFVAQSVLGRCAGRLEAGLVAAAGSRADAGTQVA